MDADDVGRARRPRRATARSLIARRAGSTPSSRTPLGHRPDPPSKRRHQITTCIPNACGASRHLLPDVAEAEQAERPPVEPARLRIFLLVPRARAQSATLSGMRRSSARISAERQLRDGDRVLAGAVRDVDAARRRGRDVDGVVAGAGADDQRQRAGVHHRRGDLRRADDEHVGRGRASRLAERLVLQRRARRRPRIRRPRGRRCRSARTCRRPGLSCGLLSCSSRIR